MTQKAAISDSARANLSGGRLHRGANITVAFLCSVSDSDISHNIARRTEYKTQPKGQIEWGTNISGLEHLRLKIIDADSISAVIFIEISSMNNAKRRSESNVCDNLRGRLDDVSGDCLILVFVFLGT